ncbi:cysteine proteinase, partial [Fragilariopsis cylindrus CCMP1102]
SGLGNMGNTCFMNSTLQCLAHTEPIRRYFLSGEYKNDLNRDNPLGTGGELATQFAILMGEMWGSLNYTNQYSSAAVYPRSFKNSLGKHAEQFCGYDQHDSQELATYLLDALHEDTNKITIKPYIEKPEQRIEESDASAADTAWELHLKREDSRVLENFMGQVKSRLECCEEGCNRVSTTFDPFMYLSVPIPGESERTLEADPDITVLDCIEKYCHKEQLEESEMWYCSSCRNHVRAWKQFHLFRAPPILIVHLKRFYFSASTHRRDKITKKIDFPLKGLDLTELVADYSIDNKPIYDCYAVSNHFGGLGGGHYTAYILSDDGTWCNYDDSHVTTNVDPTDVVSASAYVLYYRR